MGSPHTPHTVSDLPTCFNPFPSPYQVARVLLSWDYGRYGFNHPDQDTGDIRLVGRREVESLLRTFL